MIAEIKHKTTSRLEDELTGNFFGIMRYIPFTRGLQVLMDKYAKSNDKAFFEIIESNTTEEFEFEFWKRSAYGYGEIDGFIEVGNIGIGIEVKYFSDLSGIDQLEREAAMLNEWCNSGRKILLFVADEKDAKAVYQNNCNKTCFEDVHLGYITWQDILLGLDDVITVNRYEDLMIQDLKALLYEKGFVSFKGFCDCGISVDGGDAMNTGENIHNAFAVVFETMKSIEKLMTKCRAELDEEKYYMPAERFMRHSSDLSWEGFIYWSFILLFQRKEDGEVMDNGWINAPVYAVEINVDSDTCDEPQLIIAKMDFGDLTDWSKGCSPSNHELFYNAIHANGLYEEKGREGDVVIIGACKGVREKVRNAFWGFRELKYVVKNLVDVTQDNYKKIIFGTIEDLSMIK